MLASLVHLELKTQSFTNGRQALTGPTKLHSTHPFLCFALLCFVCLDWVWLKSRLSGKAQLHLPASAPLVLVIQACTYYLFPLVNGLCGNVQAFEVVHVALSEFTLVHEDPCGRREPMQGSRGWGCAWTRAAGASCKDTGGWRVCRPCVCTAACPGRRDAPCAPCAR